MFKKFISIFACLAAVIIPAGAQGIIGIQPTVTFFEDGRAPVVTEAVRVGGMFLIRYMGSTPKGVDTAYVTGDSLVIVTYRDSLIHLSGQQASILPPYLSGPEVTFMRAGMLQVLERVKGGMAPVAAFRVLPLLKTVPVLPVTGVSAGIDLALGLSHNGCNPTYLFTNAVTSDSSIRLSWTERPHSGGCLGIYLDPPVRYGPLFDLGTLDAGTYTVYIEDTLAVGSFSVENAVPVGGVVYRMKHPFTDDLSRPVEGVKVMAEVYEPCDFGTGTFEGPVCSTFTGSDGTFSLSLPRAGLDYTLVTAAAGYHDQGIVYDPARSALHEFRLIPDTDTAAVPVDITVQDGRGAPFESVMVTISGGRTQSFCPVFLTKTTGITYNGMSDAHGTIAFEDISLSPFIDYVYNARRYGAHPVSQTGVFRLYRAGGYENEIIIDIASSGIDGPGPDSKGRLSVDTPENPVTGAVLRIRFAADEPVSLSLFHQSGELMRIADGNREGEAVFSTRGLAAGVYLVRARAGERTEIRRVLIP